MTTNYEISYPTGLYIPVKKRSSFMVTFLDMLVYSHNVVPFFGPVSRENTCEVKLNSLGNKSFAPGSFVRGIENAVAFLRANMSVLERRKFSKKKRKLNNVQTTPQVITLEDESEVRTVDLTEVDQGDPEIIVLKESIVRSGRRTRQSSCNISIVDLTDNNESSTNPSKSKESENEIKVLNVKRFVPEVTPLRSMNSKEIKVGRLNRLKSPSKTGKKRKKKNLKEPKKQKKTKFSRKSKSNLSTKSVSLTSLSSSDSLPRKKRKLQDISNISSASSCNLCTSFIKSSNLSENTMKYYENLSKVIGKVGGEKNESSTRSGRSFKNHIVNNVKRKTSSLAKKMSPVRVCLDTNKTRRVLIPQNNFGHKDLRNSQRKFSQKPSTVYNSPGRTSKRILQKGISNSKTIGETNSFNPNPFEVDLEGLRPIVIDGCNVAIGHGKRTYFSAKGLKICVDYFAARGHTQIKLFLPQFRQQEFSAELLETLKTKCDVVFTPSQYINGLRRTPYDDRFIVQYATEFGGVIVSTDNYRDLARENPRWQDTIAKRLLMFTWVDDFLMFPVDPLGRSGPTLEEFLRF